MNDLYFDILLYSDINTIQSFCLTNKTNHLICNLKFWIFKFKKYDHLQGYNENFRQFSYIEWIKEYKLAKNAKDFMTIYKKDINEGKDVSIKINVTDDFIIIDQKTKFINENNVTHVLYTINNKSLKTEFVKPYFYLFECVFNRFQMIDIDNVDAILYIFGYHLYPKYRPNI